MSAAKRPKLEVAMEPVLPEDLTEDVPLIEAYTGIILDAKSISRMVVDLNSTIPISELAHLKRVRAKEILLFPTTFTTPDKVIEVLKRKGFNVEWISDQINVVQVAEVPPKTKKQYDVVNKLWPCNFHSNKYLEKLCTNSLFNVSELEDHKRFMRMCIDVSKHGIKAGAIVVDPKTRSVVAVGFDKTSENPNKHAVMVAIDNVARTQDGGAWEPIEDGDGASLAGIPGNILDDLNANYPGNSFGASCYKGKDEIESPDDGPYLCTNYYVYVTHEPCIMCAMALIHSRAKRVFYGTSVPEGALGTACKIHTVKDLNHHYEAFRGLLKEECERLNGS
ncbi:PREDICTED: probable inactive tRNA-specific adenosine deaminase-like protein 3 [Nicrophorus vespilloides]|uniref:Probable inactive tRNA-specific adenosine deaminase-like protein 3 n=1 Tax=Nicrophorus vespilloides TaxID=110193 RepID=A0ABM1NIE2_NICVS|nr:PREDICTED: probable inactive tRNA-specific adenosine deaminase-like protein 3 [Nicrophorus vespilloides]